MRESRRKRIRVLDARIAELEYELAMREMEAQRCRLQRSDLYTELHSARSEFIRKASLQANDAIGMKARAKSASEIWEKHIQGWGARREGSE